MLLIKECISSLKVVHQKAPSPKNTTAKNQKAPPPKKPFHQKAAAPKSAKKASPLKNTSAKKLLHQKTPLPKIVSNNYLHLIVHIFTNGYTILK